MQVRGIWQRFMNNELIIQRLSDLAAWYQAPFGDELKVQIAARLNDTMSRLALREALCLGVAGFEEAFTGGQHKWATFFSNLDCVDWLAERDHCLPLKPDSQECVVIPHGLDIALNPHAILRELDRVVTEDGYLVIIGFNPISLLGFYRPIGRLFNRHPVKVPWSLQFYRLGRLRDWLELLSFDICQIKTVGIIPYVKREKLKLLSATIDSVGLTLLPSIGNVYVLLAKKRTVPMTPIKMKWKAEPASLLKAGLPKTTVGQS